MVKRLILCVLVLSILIPVAWFATCRLSTGNTQEPAVENVVDDTDEVLSVSENDTKLTVECATLVFEEIKRTNLYPDCGIVIDVDEETDMVTFQTQNGNTFSFYCTWEFYFVGDLVAVIMDNSGTPEVYDDVIVSDKYVGWVCDNCNDGWVK